MPERHYRRWLDSGRLALHPSALPAPPAQRPLPAWDRVEGMLLGLAIGDALGNPAESLIPALRHHRFGEIRTYLPNERAGDQCVGLPSDDTQLAAWTLEVINERGRPDIHLLSERFASRRIDGMGQTIAAFVKAWRSGKRGLDAAQCSAGNGALMRIAPVLVPHLQRSGRDLWRDAVVLGAMTHNDWASNAACVAFVGMLWDLVGMTEPPPPEWWLDRYVALAGPLDAGTVYHSRAPLAWSGAVSEFVNTQVRTALAEDLSVADADARWQSSAYLLETVPTALFILARHGHDPEAAILRAVNDTWDNDTIGAIVGAAVGALHGKKRLPDAWRAGLLGRTAEGDDGHFFALLATAGEAWQSAEKLALWIRSYPQLRRTERLAFEQWLGAIEQRAEATANQLFGRNGTTFAGSVAATVVAEITDKATAGQWAWSQQRESQAIRTLTRSRGRDLNRRRRAGLLLGDRERAAEPEAMPGMDDLHFAKLEAADRVQQIRALVRDMPPGPRQVFLAIQLEHLTPDEIAQVRAETRAHPNAHDFPAELVRARNWVDQNRGRAREWLTQKYGPGGKP